MQDAICGPISVANFGVVEPESCYLATCCGCKILQQLSEGWELGERVMKVVVFRSGLSFAQMGY
jgi:hypothetical protein